MTLEKVERALRAEVAATDALAETVATHVARLSKAYPGDVPMAVTMTVADIAATENRRDVLRARLESQVALAGGLLAGRR